MNAPGGEKNAAVLALDGISFGYPGSPDLFRDMSLELAGGAMIGLVGPNGSGKSTLIKMMNGLVRPRSGSVKLFGRDLGEFGRRDLATRMAVVHQGQPLLFPYTVEETVAMGRWARAGALGWIGRRDREVVEEAMARTEVAGLRLRRLSDLSGGERQRVYIARALAQEGELLLLDEPVAHLDLKHQFSILRLVRELNRTAGLTVLLALHDLNLAAEFCRHLVVLKEGAVAARGAPEEVLKPRLLLDVFGIEALVDKNPLTGCLRITVMA